MSRSIELPRMKTHTGLEIRFGMGMELRTGNESEF